MSLLSKSIIIGFLMGLSARIITLKSDYRRYPSYPQGFAVHIVLGAVSALIGALVIPSVMDGEYAAVSFFTLAVQQFREVRNAERDTLTNLEESEIVKRGNAYIEDIARKFEVRNYLAMITAFLVSVTILWIKNIYIGVGVGVCIVFLIMRFIKEKYIKDISDVESVELYFDKSYLVAGDVIISNMATKEIQKMWISKGNAVRIIPKNENDRMSLANLGQQQAIVHDVISQLGTINDADEPWLLPFAKMDVNDGSIIIGAVTYKNDEKQIITAVKNCPVIEFARKEPRKSKAYKA